MKVNSKIIKEQKLKKQRENEVFGYTNEYDEYEKYY